MQEAKAWPSTITVQAPHSPSPAALLGAGQAQALAQEVQQALAPPATSAWTG